MCTSVPHASYMHRLSTRNASDAQISPTTNHDSASTKNRAQTAKPIFILFKSSSSLERPATHMSVVYVRSAPTLSTSEASLVLGMLNMTSDSDIDTQTRPHEPTKSHKIGTYGTLPLTTHAECKHYQRPNASGRDETGHGWRQPITDQM